MVLESCAQKAFLHDLLVSIHHQSHLKLRPWLLRQADAENVIAGLNVLRNVRRGLTSKLAELQMDLHEIMIDGDSDSLTAFWLSGRSAPSLQNNRDKISKLIEMLER